MWAPDLRASSHCSARPGWLVAVMRVVLTLLAVASARAFSAGCCSLQRQQLHNPVTRRVVQPLLSSGSFNFFDWLETRLARRRFRAYRPERIILVRHGQSEGNTNKDAYAQTPDSLIPLTERGFAQGAAAGLQIRKLVGNETVRFFYSPYMRAQQTLLSILQAFDMQTVQISQETRLREQACATRLLHQHHHTHHALPPAGRAVIA